MNRADDSAPASTVRPALPVVVRVIAIVEAAKGALALLAGIGLLRLGRENVQTVAEQFIRFCHFDPAGRYPRAFVEAAGRLTVTDIQVLALVALLYAAIRAVESYWLWNTRPWAEWFALGSTCFYLPAEIYELTQQVTWLMLGVLVVNLAIAGYLANALRHGAAWNHFLLGARFAPGRPQTSSSNPA